MVEGLQIIVTKRLPNIFAKVWFNENIFSHFTKDTINPTVL